MVCLKWGLGYNKTDRRQSRDQTFETTFLSGSGWDISTSTVMMMVVV